MKTVLMITRKILERSQRSEVVNFSQIKTGQVNQEIKISSSLTKSNKRMMMMNLVNGMTLRIIRKRINKIMIKLNLVTTRNRNLTYQNKMILITAPRNNRIVTIKIYQNLMISKLSNRNQKNLKQYYLLQSQKLN